MRIFLLTLLFTATAALAQTCSPAAPCVQLTIKSAGANAIETTGINSAGLRVEVTGPVNLTLLKCLSACGAPGGAGWVPVTQNPIGMTGTVVLNDPEAPGTTANYAGQVAWADPIYGSVQSAWGTVTVTIPATQQNAGTAPGKPVISVAVQTQ